ncbi:hypothetical protein CMV_020382 [Castanea mollissima]|uniref:pectinesterase n=1 Tax=Castanea mollissima TaxID=60419 RepID=A0A8J4VAE6_9ROSI|nr:hypothetical protein CMV_020382 [Castanea mollissima]
MQSLRLFSLITLLLLYCNVSRSAFLCKLNKANPFKVAFTITVDIAGHGNFTTIQSAIDSIPSGNAKWIRIQIFAGVYREKVTITYDKTCIFLDGAGSRETFIEWDGHESTNTSYTFTSYAKNLVVKGIGFKNTYNLGPKQNDLVPALSAEILGDKAASYNCSFFGVQDTLWDVGGRHYFYQCYIQGGADFIFGNGQSFYEQSVLYYSLETYGNGTYIGYITAQGRDSAEESSGFVFKDCVIHGRGIAYLGRAWKAFSRVVIANSKLSDIVVPVGWDAWQFVGHEDQLTYAEVDNSGRGAETSKRVPWLKKLSACEIRQFLSVDKFINQDGWIAKLPTVN